MKKIVRHFIIDTFTLYLISLFTSGLVFERGIITLVLAGAGLTVASLFVRPIINLLLLPLNLITFNLFKWLSSAVALYLVTLAVPGFVITHFAFSGFSYSLLSLPPLSFGGLFSYVAFAFVVSTFTSSIYWLIK